MAKYDVIFIGSGHACWHAAVTLVRAGKSVALVDRDVLGGTCTNYGCDAKILLDSPFEHIDGAAIYGSDAGAWIDVLTIIINCKLSAPALGSMIFAFPTSTYGLINTLIPQMMAPPQR